MKNDVQHETELRRYLLGELPLEEQVLVEQRLFLDDEFAELQQSVEDDLIDEYLADELKGSEREQFENHFLLLPEHGADLRIAEALQKYIATRNAPATSNTSNDPPANVLPFSFLNKRIVWLSLAFAALVILSLITWNAFRATRGPAADGPVEAGVPRPANTQPPDRQQPAPQNQNGVETAEKGNTNESGVNPDNSGKPAERRSTPAHLTVSAVLIAGNPSRSVGSIKTVTIFADTKEVLLLLPLEFRESYEKYRAELLRRENRINEWPNLTSETDETYGPVVSVTISADLLRERSYRIKLHGIPPEQQSAEPPASYFFNVQRR